METEETQLCLKWNNFRDTVLSYFGYLRDEEEFVDVTLSCEGKIMRAHKVVLAASSPYLQSLLEESPCKHPCIILDDVPFNHIEALVSFVYTGKVRVAEDELPAFLDSANLLKIRGLSDVALSQSPDSPDEPPATVKTEGEDNTASVERCSSVLTTEENNRDKGWGSTVNATSSATFIPHRQQGRRSEENISLAESRRRSADIQTSPSTTFVDDASCGKRPASAESGEGPSACKRSSLPVTRRSSGPSPQFQVGNEELQKQPAVNGVTEAELTTMGGPTPAPFFGQMQFNWRQDLDVDYSQGDARRRHSLDPRPCPVCNRVYSNLSNLRQHLRLIHNPKFVTCHLCSKTFKTDLYLRRHIMSYHDLSNVNPDTGVQVVAPVPLSVVEVNSYHDSSGQQSLQSALANVNSMKGDVTT